jgi:hypothetical protein
MSFPALDNEISVRHAGLTETAFTNQDGPPLQWKASFPLSSPDSHPQILVDGKLVPAITEQLVNRQAIASVLISVKSGQTRTARYVVRSTKIN